MKQKILSLLVLLLTAATGAWADETPLLTINSTDYQSFYRGSNTFDDKVTVTFSNEVYNAGDEWGWYTIIDNSSLLTVAGINGYTITSCKFYTKDGIAANGYTVEGESPSVYLSDLAVFPDDSKSVNIGSYGITKIEVYGAAAPTEPDVEVTTNAAEEGATFTEASFQMPAFDATADYELVRDMSVQMTATMGDGTDGVRYRVKKAQQGEGYEPADLNMMQVLALVAVNDGIEQKALTLNQDFFCRIYKLDEQTLQPVGDGMLLSEFNFAPGLYALKAFAQGGSDYEGETALSNTFKLFQGYEVEVAAKEFITYYKDEPLYADTETSADAQLYTISDVSGDQAQLSAAIETAPSYTPLLIFNNSDQDKTFLLIPANEEPSPISYYGGFIGTTDAATILASTEGTTNYALNGKAFVFVKNDLAIGPNKAWLSISNSNARAITLVFDEATGVKEVKEVIEVKDDSFYDLNGRKVNAPTKKGVYIMNGKKVVVK